MSFTLPAPRRLFAASLIVSILLGTAIATTPASAMRVGPGIDGVSVACRGLQNQADGLIAEYGNPDTTNDRRGEILDQLRSIGTDWINIGCRSAFGNIEGPAIMHRLFNPVAPPVTKIPSKTH